VRDIKQYQKHVCYKNGAFLRNVNEFVEEDLDHIAVLSRSDANDFDLPPRLPLREAMMRFVVYCNGNNPLPGVLVQCYNDLDMKQNSLRIGILESAAANEQTVPQDDTFSSLVRDIDEGCCVATQGIKKEHYVQFKSATGSVLSVVLNNQSGNTTDWGERFEKKAIEFVVLSDAKLIQSIVREASNKKSETIRFSVSTVKVEDADIHSLHSAGAKKAFKQFQTEVKKQPRTLWVSFDYQGGKSRSQFNTALIPIKKNIRDSYSITVSVDKLASLFSHLNGTIYLYLCKNGDEKFLLFYVLNEEDNNRMKVSVPPTREHRIRDESDDGGAEGDAEKPKKKKMPKKETVDSGRPLPIAHPLSWHPAQYVSFVVASKVDEESDASSEESDDDD